MGSKSKKKLEIEFQGMGTKDLKVKTIQLRADKDLSDAVMGKHKRKGRR